MGKRYLSYSGMRRIFLGLFITIFLGVNIVAYFLYSVFSATLVSEINTGTGQTLAKIKNGMELIYNDIISLMTQMAFGDITLTRMMFETGRDRILEYQGYQILKRTMMSHPFVDYLGIYNERLDLIMTTCDFTSESQARLKGLANNYYRRAANTQTILISLQKGAPVSVLDSITLVMYSSLSLENDKGALLMGIKLSYFQQLVQQINKGDLEEVIIFHDSGQLITSSNHDYGKEDFIRTIQNLPDESGFFLSRVSGEETHVSFTRSRPLGWTFISLSPYKSMVSGLNSLRLIVFFITLGILCAGILISYFMAVSMYRPVYRLLRQFNYFPSKRSLLSSNPEGAYIEKQIDSLRSTADMSETLIRNYTVMNLLKNQNTESDAINMKILEPAFGDPFYMVCLVSIDEQRAWERLDAAGQEKIRRHIISIGGGFLKQCCKSVDYGIVKPADIAFVLHLGDGVCPPALIPMLAETIEAVKDASGQSISCAVSSIVNSIFAINDSYEETDVLMGERYYAGFGNVILKKPDGGRVKTGYPEDIADALCNALFSGDSQGITEGVNKFAAYLRETARDYIQIHLNTVIMRMLSHYLSHTIPVDAPSFYSVFQELCELETLERVRERFSGFCLALAQGFREKEPEPLPALVNDSIALAEKFYTDPLFNVNVAAGWLNITPSYFNRVFKKNMGKSFSEYLGEYRMEIAKRLLRETNNSIGSIPNAVGISNINYFYTLFKKMYNFTPQQFRRLNRRS
jgi:AraC-like DNA-binding protein